MTFWRADGGALYASAEEAGAAGEAETLNALQFVSEPIVRGDGGQRIRVFQRLRNFDLRLNDVQQDGIRLERLFPGDIPGAHEPYSYSGNANDVMVGKVAPDRPADFDVHYTVAVPVEGLVLFLTPFRGGPGGGLPAGVRGGGSLSDG